MLRHMSPHCTETTNKDGSPLNTKEQVDALQNKIFFSAQTHMMDAKVNDAEVSDGTKYYQEGLEDFNSIMCWTKNLIILLYKR